MLALRILLLANAALLATAAVLPRLAPGGQFITGACTSDADCASACCGFHSGKCAGPVIAQERDGGCGFGDVAPNNVAALKTGSHEAAAGVDNSKAGQRVAGAGSAPAPAPSTAVASMAAASVATATPAPTSAASAPLAAGTQFITGTCSADADCASSCCGFHSGKCAGPVIAQERDGGCGFGDVAPNNLATLKDGSSAAASGVDNSKAGVRASESANATAVASSVAGSAPAAPPTAAASAPASTGTQFITGACAADAECASGCCSAPGTCAARAVATGPGGKGCGFAAAGAARRRRGLSVLAGLV